MNKLDIEQFKASPMIGRKDTYNTTDLRIQELAEKINEIIDSLPKDLCISSEHNTPYHLCHLPQQKEECKQVPSKPFLGNGTNKEIFKAMNDFVESPQDWQRRLREACIQICVMLDKTLPNKYSSSFLETIEDKIEDILRPIVFTEIERAREEGLNLIKSQWTKKNYLQGRLDTIDEIGRKVEKMKREQYDFGIQDPAYAEQEGWNSALDQEINYKRSQLKELE